jgi:hydroxyacylglutathione hydrolase
LEIFFLVCWRYGGYMKRQKTIAIIGGGVSGTLTAFHLAQQQVQAEIVLIDPHPAPGLGLAYSTSSQRHLLNVPAGKISALPDQPRHFVEWLRAHHDPSMTESDFAPRAVFGRYIQSLLSATPAVKHRRTSAVDAEISGRQVRLHLADQTTLLADAVVVATGNFDPAPMRGVAEEAVHSGAYCHSAWKDSTYTNLPEDAPVVLIGSGLTAVDVLLRLRELGHSGQVTTVSRHAFFPRRHARYEPLATCLIPDRPPASARLLLRIVHRAIKAGMDWRAVIDSLRARTNELWQALPLAEQRRFHRHLQRRWEIVRHRMAPPIADLIDAELQAGTLTQVQGSVQAVVPSPLGARVLFRRGGVTREIDAARVINCTGPDTNYRRVNSPLLANLFAKKLIVPGPHGSGLWTNQSGALKDTNGAFSDLLFHVGPGRQGTLLESIAVPELRQQAKDMAELLAASFAKQAGVATFAGNDSAPGHLQGRYELAH